MKSIVLSGAHVKIYIGGTLYPEAQSVNVNISYGETPIYGVDSSLPQEIAGGTISVDGNISGILIKQTSGLQGKGVMTKLADKMAQPYVSLELRDRSSDEKIIFIPQVKITNEQYSVASKGNLKYSFSFAGIRPLTQADLG